MKNLYLVIQTPWSSGKQEIGGIFSTERRAQAAIDIRDPDHSWYSIQELALDELTPEEPSRPVGYWYNPGRGREEVPEEAWAAFGAPPA